MVNKADVALVTLATRRHLRMIAGVLWLWLWVVIAAETAALPTTILLVGYSE